MRELGISETGEKVDLWKLFGRVLNHVERLDAYVDRFVTSNPQVVKMAESADWLYSNQLVGHGLIAEQRSTTALLGLGESEVKMANAYTVLVFLGLAHFLHWQGLGIADPASPDEWMTKLASARELAVWVGYAGLKRSVSDDGTTSQHDPAVARRSFLVGLALGQLVADVHRRDGSGADHFFCGKPPGTAPRDASRYAAGTT